MGVVGKSFSKPPDDETTADVARSTHPVYLAECVIEGWYDGFNGHVGRQSGATSDRVAGT